MKILAIESSCDETAAAVVEDGRRVLSQTIRSQIETHALYGGVVPEIASRQHIESIAQLTEQALHAACEKFIRRFTAMEQTALSEGRPLETLSKDELLAGWNAQKRVVPGGEQ